MLKGRISDFLAITMKYTMRTEIDYVLDQKLLGRTLILDLDDTIYDESQFLRQQYLSLAEKFCPSDIDLGYRFLLETFSQYGRANLFQKFQSQFKLRYKVSDILAAFRDYGVSGSLSLECHQWVKDLLFYYKADDPLFVITNGHVPQQAEKIRRLGLDKIHPEVLVIFANKFAPKPSVASYHHLSSNLQLTNPIYIGDSNTDREFARNCSIEFFDISNSNINENAVR